MFRFNALLEDEAVSKIGEQTLHYGGGLIRRGFLWVIPRHVGQHLGFRSHRLLLSWNGFRNGVVQRRQPGRPIRQNVIRCQIVAETATAIDTITEIRQNTGGLLGAIVSQVVVREYQESLVMIFEFGCRRWRV